MNETEYQQYNHIIAEVEFLTCWRQDIQPSKRPPLYSDFKKNNVPLSSDHSRIEIELIASPPPVRPGKRLFVTDGIWTLYEAGEEYFIRWGPPTEKTKWEWYIIASHDFQTAQLYYDRTYYDCSTEQRSPVGLVHYPLDQFFLSNYLADRGGLIVHSAGGELTGKGILFPGVSGAGKSTITNLMKEIDTNHFFSDDRMIIRQTGDGWHCFGTPWAGDAMIAENKRSKLNAILFITKSSEVSITPVSPAWALQRLLRVSSIPWYNEERMQRCLDLCEKLIAEVPMYECCFSNTPKAAREISEKLATL